MTGRCTDVKEIGKRFMGGTELREQANETKLKSIDDFNKEAQGSGTESGSPSAVIERLRNALFEVGIDKELFDQVVEGMKKEYEGSESEILSAVSEQLGESSKTKKGINCHSLFSFLIDVCMVVHAFSVCVHIMSLSCQSLCFLLLLAIFVGCAFHVCCFSCFIVRIFWATYLSFVKRI